MSDPIDSESLREAERFCREIAFRNYYALCLYRSVWLGSLDKPNGQTAVGDWLSGAGYDTTPEAICAAAAGLRRQDVSFWAGRYELFVGSFPGPRLIINDDGVFLDAARISAFTYRDDVLAWRLEDGNTTAADIRFSLSVTDSPGRIPAPDAYCGPMCSGRLSSKDASLEGDNVLGKIGVYTLAAAQDAAATDPLEAWAGSYDLHVSDWPGPDNPPSRFVVDGVGQTVDLGSGSMAFGDARLKWTSPVLSWTDLGLPPVSGRLSFSRARGRSLPSVTGKVWNSTGNAPAADNVTGVIDASHISDLGGWAGTYSVSEIRADGAQGPAWPDLVVGSDGSVTFNGAGLSDMTYYRSDSLLVWSGVKDDGFAYHAGRIVFDTSTVQQTAVFTGVFWDTAGGTVMPEGNNIAGVLRPAGADAGAGGSAAAAEDRAFNTADLFMYLLAGVGAVIPLYWKYREMRREAEAQAAREQVRAAMPRVVDAADNAAEPHIPVPVPHGPAQQREAAIEFAQRNVAAADLAQRQAQEMAEAARGNQEALDADIGRHREAEAEFRQAAEQADGEEREHLLSEERAQAVAIEDEEARAEAEIEHSSIKWHDDDAEEARKEEDGVRRLPE